jgi:two-component system nitrate/nitrite response regulator NarL
MSIPEPSQSVSLLLIDDHELFRFGVRAFMQPHPHIKVVGEAADGASGLAMARQFHPAVILLDMQMPDMTGLQVLAQLRRDCPRSAVLMLTSSEDASDLAEALRGGACGYLLKSADADFLVRAVGRAAAGEVIVAEAMTSKLVQQLRVPNAAATDLASLTPREKQILRRLAHGESNKVIARTLSLAENTVKIHVQHVLRKLSLSSRVQAAVFAVENASVLGE